LTEIQEKQRADQKHLSATTPMVKLDVSVLVKRLVTDQNVADVETDVPFHSSQQDENLYCVVAVSEEIEVAKSVEDLIINDHLEGLTISDHLAQL